MAKEEPKTIRTQITVPYTMAMGSTWTRFFEGLKQEKIFGTKCKKCGRVLVPARPFCPRCFESDMEWVEVSQEGVIGVWCYVNYKYFGIPREIPFVTCALRLDGVDCNIAHLLGGVDISDVDKVRKRVKPGSRGKIVWRKEKRGEWWDIAYIKPV